ncbi:N-glycosylation protein-domain-containing protein [Coniochaeta sp. 2T2.1]|nr:N-glycosylation protein-domain-containing protein [Coniochaeta sp. 2T2.1]
MPRPASTSARRHDSNHNHIPQTSPPPSYSDHHASASLKLKRTSSNVSLPASNPPLLSSLSTTLPDANTTVHSSLLQPRVAVALGLSAKWHPLLFVCRLMSILPALWWGIPVALRLLAQVLVLVGNSRAVCASSGIPWLRGYGKPDLRGGGGKGGGGEMYDLDLGGLDFETRLTMTEMALGIIWCSSSAYLSFTFTDCLMSRWLLLYTPQATLVRLLAINTTNLYLTSQTLHLTGGSADSRLFLPAWITIATTLTGLYHLTQRKINIRKETRLSMSVFSIASFISMVSLLATVQAADRPAWPRVPVVEAGWAVVGMAERGWGRLAEMGERGSGRMKDGL